MRYRAAADDALLIRSLDAFTAVFHRPSGQTHLLAAPAPEILAALAAGPMTLDALHAALAADYELDGAEGLATRLDELVAVGLVSREAM